MEIPRLLEVAGSLLLESKADRREERIRTPVNSFHSRWPWTSLWSCQAYWAAETVVVGCAVKFSDCRPAPRDFSGDSVDMKEVPIMQASPGKLRTVLREGYSFLSWPLSQAPLHHLKFCQALLCSVSVLLYLGPSCPAPCQWVWPSTQTLCLPEGPWSVSQEVGTPCFVQKAGFRSGSGSPHEYWKTPHVITLAPPQTPSVDGQSCGLFMTDPSQSAAGCREWYSRPVLSVYPPL